MAGTVTTLDFNLANNLDGDTYTIGDEGARGSLPEGLLGLSGNLNALFNSSALDLLNKAISAQESSLKITITDSVTDYYKLEMLLPEVRYGRATPPVDGPQGVRLALPWQGYYADAAEETAVQITLKNNRETY